MVNLINNLPYLNLRDDCQEFPLEELKKTPSNTPVNNLPYLNLRDDCQEFPLEELEKTPPNTPESRSPSTSSFLLSSKESIKWTISREQLYKIQECDNQPSAQEAQAHPTLNFPIN